MTAEGWVAIIGALGSMITAVLGALAVILVRNVKSEVIDARTDVAEVHTMVNQQRTDAKRYEELLVQTLRQADVKVPKDVSLGPPN